MPLMAWSEISGPRVPIEDLRCAQERGIAGAKRYLFCSTEKDAHEAFDAHRRLFPRRYKRPRRVARNPLRSSYGLRDFAGRLPSPERRAELQDLIDSVNK